MYSSFLQQTPTIFLLKRKWYKLAGQASITLFLNLLPLLAAQGQTQNFTVSSSFSPGIEVTAGQEVTIEAQGSIVLGLFAGATTPGGIEGYQSYNLEPSFKHGALLFRVGNGNYSAMTAPAVKFKARNTGPLTFVVNDRDPSNNSGYFRVKVSVGSASSSLARTNNDRKKGFVYKSDAYWSSLGSDAMLKDLFEGNFTSVFKDENFESFFTAFVENYSENCAAYIPKSVDVVIRKTESGTDAYGSSYAYTYDAHTFQVDSRIADTFIYYLNKQEYNSFGDLIGVFANNTKTSPTSGELISGTFKQPINALLVMRNFFRGEICDCATMKQMRENLYRFALDQNSLQEDNVFVAGAEKESQH